MAIKYKRYKPKRKGKRYFVNDRIKFPKLQVLTNNGENLGVLSVEKALIEARKRELDLVVISEKAEPPVAKILEFSKYLYEDRKKQSANKAKSRKSETKEFVFGPTIGDGDLIKKIDRTKKFLKDGNRVKITIKFKGREVTHPEVGLERINKMIADLKGIAKPDAEPRLKGRIISVTFVQCQR